MRTVLPDLRPTSLAHKACGACSAARAGGQSPSLPTRGQGAGPPPSPSPPRLGHSSVISRQLDSINGPLQTKQDHCGARGGQGQPRPPATAGRVDGTYSSAWRCLPAPCSALGETKAADAVCVTPAARPCPSVWGRCKGRDVTDRGLWSSEPDVSREQRCELRGGLARDSERPR